MGLQRSSAAVCRASLFVLGLIAATAACGDTTDLDIASAAVTAGSGATTLRFPLTRSSDTGYDVYLRYHTVDGSAVAGTDYTAATATRTLAAGAASGNIPITIAAVASPGGDKSFQVLLDSATGVGPAASFGAQQSFGAGAAPSASVSADLNGDGKPDLIVTNYNDNTVSVLLNTTATGAASASFAAATSFATGSAPYSVAVADLNGDGKPDLIVANFNDNSVSVLLNTTAPGATTPSFAPQQTFAAGGGPRFVTTADINGDGKPDLIVANSSDNNVSVLLNTTAPGATVPVFAAQLTFAVGASPRSVAVADLHGNGRPDIIVANYSSNSLSVLSNTTTTGATVPSFADQKTFATDNNPASVAAVDVDGDGRPDLIVANAGSNTVWVLHNLTTPGVSTTPKFAAHVGFTTGSFPQSVTAADVNGDGKPDLIVANSGDNTLSVLSNNSAPGNSKPGFVTQQTFAIGAGLASVAAVDVNGDGHPDLFAATGSGVSVLLNTVLPNTTGAVSMAALQTAAAGDAGYSIAAADLNGDGSPDLVVANVSDNSLSVLRNTTVPGSTTTSFAVLQAFAVGTSPQSIAVADLNGDGKPDLIATSRLDNTVSVLINKTAPGATTLNFSAQKTFDTGAYPIWVTVADVNGDGKPDLIVANRVTNTVSVLLNDTTPGSFTPKFRAQKTFTVGSGPFSVVAADVNGDGKPDLIVANYFDNTVSVLINKTAAGATVPSFSAQHDFATGTSPGFLATADVNGDGKPDLIVVNVADNTVSVLLNKTAPGAANPVFFAQKPFAVGSNPAAVTVADVDGDGRPDLVVANFVDGTVSVLLNTTAPGATTPQFAAQQTLSAPYPVAVTVADINGDGQPDVIANNLTPANTLSILLNTRYQVTMPSTAATGTIHGASQ